MVGFPAGVEDRLGVARLGGHREEGENAWSCAAREVLEESTLRIRPLVPPATYWIGPEQDERSMVVAPWPTAPAGAAVPLLVGWRARPGGGMGRILSVTYLAEGEGTPLPAAETQGLLLLRPDEVRAVARGQLTLGALLEAGGKAVFRTALPTGLPLEPLTQLRALALLLDRHPELAGGGAASRGRRRGSLPGRWRLGRGRRGRGGRCWPRPRSPGGRRRGRPRGP